MKRRLLFSNNIRNGVIDNDACEKYINAKYIQYKINIFMS